MSKIIETLNKNLVIAVYAILFFFIIGFFKDCSNSKKIKEMSFQVDSLIKVIPTETRIEKKMEIEGLKSSRRTLYDWNSVVRTTQRPDDLINQYNKDIDKLNEEIKKLETK